MTKNQIEYVKVLETKRSNLENERLTGARDTAAREAKLVELAESRRHNQATEALTSQDLSIRKGSLDESIRHNQIMEGTERDKLSETSRHNREQERATIIDLGEKSRHNQVTETESARHNQATEGEIKRHNLVGEVTDAGRLTLDTVTREQQMAETKRHNLAMESKDLSPDITVHSNVSNSVPKSQEVQLSGTPPQGGTTATKERDPELATSQDFGHYRMINGELRYAYQISPHIGRWARVVERGGANYYVDHSGKYIKIG